MAACTVAPGVTYRTRFDIRSRTVYISGTLRGGQAAPLPDRTVPRAGMRWYGHALSLRVYRPARALSRQTPQPLRRSRGALTSSGLRSVPRRPNLIQPHPSSLIPHPSSLIPHPPSVAVRPDGIIAPDGVVAPYRVITPDRVVAPYRVITPDGVVAPDRVPGPGGSVAPDGVITPDSVVAPDRVVRPDRIVRPGDVSDPHPPQSLGLRPK